MSLYDTKNYSANAIIILGDRKMKILEIYQIYEKIDDFDIDKIRHKICKNLHELRLEYYNKYKELHRGAVGTENPYSITNIADYLNISIVHYKRLENENDKHKYISLENLVKLSWIFDKSLDEFLK